MSVVVPFHGSREEARGTLAALDVIDVGPHDEVIVADNTVEGALLAVAGEFPRVTAVPAPLERSSYYARNVAGEAASGEWLLFVDADCRPRATLVADYFAEPIDGRCGVVSGQVVAAAGEDTLVSRYARSRGHLDLDYFVNEDRPAAITANMLVRREAWEAVGGFHERLRSGADVEFSWRLQEAGYTFAFRRNAIVEHRHRERLRPLARQAARWSSGRAWLNRRYPGGAARPRLARELARSAAGVLVWSATFRFERALFKAIDAVVVASEWVGWTYGNASIETARVPERLIAPPRLGMAVFTDAFPALSETFVTNELRALRKAGHQVRVESSARPARPDRAAVREFPIRYLEDDGIARKLADLAWLLARHPLASAWDLAQRRRWKREEDVFPLRSLAPVARRLNAGGERHLHVHFAAGAALNGLRAARLAGIPYSVTAHAYDIYERPRNLREKLERASFATSGCDYTVRHLRRLVAREHAHQIHEIVMGVDGDALRRATPHTAARSVVAVGRLVEKKGFAYLIDAAAALARDGAVERVTIVGDGPLREQLERQVRDAGLEGVVELPGWRDPAGVRGLLEGAAVLAMPSVIAASGDRDSMPVVVKEALAMEVPVVASDEVGLPELVDERWGRLVPPHDPAALASALGELLAMTPAERASMGRAGRAHVLEHCDVRRETEKLARLIGALD